MHKKDIFLLLAITVLALIYFLVMRQEIQVNPNLGLLFSALGLLSFLFIVYFIAGLSFIFAFLATWSAFYGFYIFNNLEGYKFYILLSVIVLNSIFLLQGIFKGNLKFVLGVLFALGFVFFYVLSSMSSYY